MIHLSQRTKIDVLVLTFILRSISLVFTRCPPPVPTPRPGPHSVLGQGVSVDFSWPGQLLSLSLLLMSIGQVF